MATLTRPAARTDPPNRRRRAEGRLRGIRRMLEEGSECHAIAAQLDAVR